jgi:hypothetical protein
MDIRKWRILLAHALAVWAICAAIMFIGMAVTTMPVTLTIHAIGAPIASASLAYRYYRKHGDLQPLLVAAVFVGTALFTDFFLVAMVIEKSLEMFASFVGLWLPMILIFTAAYLTGNYVKERVPSTMKA